MDIYYLDLNPSGKPLIFFIHGLGADSDMWGFQTLALMEAGMRPVTVDLPGFGKTSMDSKKWKFKEITHRLAETVARITSEKVIVAGLSLGGVFAQNLALEYPERIRGLVLASTCTYLRPKTWRNWVYLLGRGMKVLLKNPAAQAEQVADHLFPDTSQAVYHDIVVEKIKQANPTAYRNAMKSLILFDNREKIRRLNLPVLVITGEKDGTIPPAAQTEMAGLIPGARQVILPCAGHAVNIDQPELFNLHLLEFIRSIDL